MRLMRPCGAYLLDCSAQIETIDSKNKADGSVVTEADLFRDYLALQNKMVDLERR